MLFCQLVRSVITQVGHGKGRFSAHPNAVFVSLDLLEKSINQRMELSVRHWVSLLVSSAVAWSSPSFLTLSLWHKMSTVSCSYVLIWLVSPWIFDAGFRLSASDYETDDFDVIHKQVQSQGVTWKTQRLIESASFKLQGECCAYSSVLGVLFAALGSSFNVVICRSSSQNGSLLSVGGCSFMSLWLAHLSRALGALVYQKFMCDNAAFIP
jgi:hypothetical protein